MIDSLAPGGAETSLAEMAPHLVAQGMEMHILPLGPRVDLSMRLEEAGAVVHQPKEPTSRLGNVRAIHRVAKQVNAELIHTTLFESDIAGRTAARLAGIASTSSLVVDSYSASHYAQESRIKLDAARAVDRVTAQFTTRFHAVSHSVAESVAPRLHINPRIIDVIPRGRDPKRFSYRNEGVRRTTRAELGIPPTTPLLLAVGRLEPQKGLIHLLAALPGVTAENPGTILLIAGREGRASECLRAAARPSRAEIRFLGHRSDVAALMTAADVLCFPSEREGSPGTLIEALAVGCPVVASEIPTVREVLTGVTDQVAVSLAPVGDARRIASAINATLNQGSSLSARLLKGRELFEKHYSIEGISTQMSEFFGRSAQQVARRPRLKE